MSSRLRQLLMLAARTDQLAGSDGEHWRTRCLHCRSTIGIDRTGKAWPGTTLEHIVPRSWFHKAQAFALVSLVGTPDDARNLALACARCNHQKGRGPDANGPADPRAYQIVESLLNKRLARWRADIDAG